MEWEIYKSDEHLSNIKDLLIKYMPKTVMEHNQLCSFEPTEVKNLLKYETPETAKIFKKYLIVTTNDISYDYVKYDQHDKNIATDTKIYDTDIYTAYYVIGMCSNLSELHKINDSCRNSDKYMSITNTLNSYDYCLSNINKILYDFNTSKKLLLSRH